MSIPCAQVADGKPADERLDPGSNIALVIDRVRAMPGGVRLFLVYALLILTGVGLSLRFVVDQAIAAPVSPVGVIVMVLLAYTIFTVTLVLQRKAAARGLALGLTTLAVPAIPLAVLAGQVIGALLIGVAARVVVRGLRAPAASAWLDQA